MRVQASHPLTNLLSKSSKKWLEKVRDKYIFWIIFHFPLRLRANGRNNSQHCCVNNVGSCCVCVGSVCKRMQQLPTMLGPTVYGGKDITHKSLCTLHNEPAWPQRCWKSCTNGSNIVALRFGHHGTKEMLRVVGWKVWPVSNFAQQHPTTCNRVCKRTQHVTSNNVGSCWPTMLRPFARGFR